MRPNNETSPHILNASSNLLGICFILLTSLKLFKLSEATIVDEIVSVATVFFMASCIFSFLSIRLNSERGIKFERAANVIFMLGLFNLFASTMMIMLNVIK